MSTLVIAPESGFSFFQWPTNSSALLPAGGGAAENAAGVCWELIVAGATSLSECLNTPIWFSAISKPVMAVTSVADPAIMAGSVCPPRFCLSPLGELLLELHRLARKRKHHIKRWGNGKLIP